MARGGFHLLEAEGLAVEPNAGAPPDLVLVTASSADERLEHALLVLSGDAWRSIPRMVLLGGRDRTDPSRR